MYNKILIVIALSALSFSCSSDQEVQSSEEEFVKTVNVESYIIEPTTFKNYLRVVGRVETSDDILVSSEVGGRLLKYNVKAGDRVKAGEVIAKIDDSKLKSEQQRLQAQTSQAETTFTRLEKIYKDSNIGSELDYLNAKYAYEQSNAALQSINVDVENTNVKSPINGIVENIIVEAGEMASPGMQIVRIIGSERLVISAGVPARYSPDVNKGDEVEIWFDGQRDTLLASIDFVASSINTQNRTFTIEIPVSNFENNPKVEMLANLRLNTKTESNVLVVSDEFIYKDTEDYVIYIKSTDEDGNSIAKKRVVTLGSTYKTDAVISSGIEAGDEIITNGSAFLTDGIRINVLENLKDAYAAQ